MGSPKKSEISDKIIKLNKDFVPCDVKEGDELFQNGIFEFNITRMIDFIRSNPSDFVVEKVHVREFPREFSSINEKHMNNVKIGDPIILAEISPGRYSLIDGNHHMEKARRLGLENMQAYKIKVEQHIRFLTSMRAYNAYIEYWNSKL
jgi:hypothetical protein